MSLLGGWLLASLALQQSAPRRADSASAASDSAVTLAAITVHAERSARHAPLASAALHRSQLAVAGTDARQMLRYARTLAGVTLPGDALFVDGLPAERLPSPDVILILSVNVDPFSVRFAESDNNVIEVTSDDPGAPFSWRLARAPGIAARNALDPRLRSRREHAAARVSGAAGTPAVLYSVEIARASAHVQQPVFAPPGSTDAAVAASRARADHATLGITAHGDAMRHRVSLHVADAEETGAGAGAMVSPAAAATQRSSERAIHMTSQAAPGGLLYRGGWAYRDATTHLLGAANQATIAVLASFTGGAPSLAQARLHTRELRWQGHVTTSDSRLLVGASLARARDSEHLLPNPHGQLVFGTLDAYEHWRAGGAPQSHLRTAASYVGVATVRAAAFTEREWRTARAALRAGLRVDHESRGGTLLSPRLSSSGTRGAWSASGGVGVFRQTVPNVILLQAARHACDSGCARTVTQAGGSPELLLSRLASRLARPGAIIARQGASWSGGALTAGVEYTYTSGFGRLGSRRLSEGAGWVDLLESNRGLRRQQLHARAGAVVRGLTITAHHEWLWSRDESDGPFSFPEFQETGATWARSAGVSPRQMAIMAALPPLAGTNMSLAWTTRAAAPMDVRTGVDVDGTRLFAGRLGGRNSGWGPRHASLDLYASRSVALPHWLTFGAVAFADLAVAGDNLLDVRNYASYGANVTSPMHGQPVAAHPGREVRLHMSVRR